MNKVYYRDSARKIAERHIKIRSLSKKEQEAIDFS